ncbi:MAG TPA: MqnA/MqnD/SBP family protein [Bacteroidota bacterium]|nr:MqnA/MqnD/SBP family protein [Bacteroidota bacterium]
MTPHRRLGVPQDYSSLPLVAHLAERDLFVRHSDVPARLALQLRERKLDAAFLTPLDYARESSAYEIVPAVGVASDQGTGSVSLLFREEHLHTVSTVAVDPSSSAEIVLAKIVLAEEYNLEPTFTPAAGPVEQLLQTADAVVLSGDASLREVDRYPNRIDLVEAWVDMTSLPYVHGIWCARRGLLSSEQVEHLQQSAGKGIASLDALAAEVSGKRFPSLSQTLLADYLHAFSYTLTDRDLDGFQEFLRFAYYHGVVPDVGDLHFCTSTSAEGSDEEQA